MLGTKLPLGRVVATPAVLKRIEQDDLVTALAQHANRDWGDVGPDDWKANDEALESDARVRQRYSNAAAWQRSSSKRRPTQVSCRQTAWWFLARMP